MDGVTSLEIKQPNNYFYMIPLPSRRENGVLPLPYLRELSMLGRYEKNTMLSIQKFVKDGKGGISTLTLPSGWEHEDVQKWESLKSMVPNFQVR